MRKIAASFALLITLPFIASAETAEELQVRIQALLQQVQALQTQTASTPTTAMGTAQCPLISRTLKLGSSGADVTRLQQFLARDAAIYPSAKVTGYYGALTEAAVKRFQCANKIVCDGSPSSTGYGVTGPRTAALLALQCSGGTGTTGAGTGASVGGYIRVTPIQGPAPLPVAVEVHVNTTKSCSGATYELLYGDNTPASIVVVPNGGCAEMVQTFTHTYTSGGTYTVTLRAGGHQTSATVTVLGGTSGGSNEDSLSVSPTSGSAPLNVSLTGKANGSGSCSAQTYTMQFGDNSTATIPVTNCYSSTYAITHTYQSSGNYTARLMRGSSEVASKSITVSGPSASAPNAPGGGTFTAELGHGGDVFTVLARFTLPTSCTAYEVVWGDGTSPATQSQGSCSGGEVTKEITHTYAGNGTYTITLKRGSGTGLTTHTAGVTVAY
ncbi:MAG: peptidoglycan-binding protein [Minisyncoccia bacterium]